jgi:AraC family transcriptional regulator
MSDDRVLYASPLLEVAFFRCPPHDVRWRTKNVIDSPAPLVAFPQLPVGVRPTGSSPVLATPNLAMLYNPGQEYERRLIDARGDSCIYIVLHSPLLASLEREDCVIRDGELVTTYAPVDRGAYLQQHLIARHLAGEHHDALFVEESALQLLRSVLRREAARATREAHRALAEAAKELLVATMTEPLSLHELAARLCVSPFHLARVFRRETGYSLHAYRIHLRLRQALVRLPESRGNLTGLALELGFASHSHFTDSFRRAFGVAPSAVA